MKSGEVLRMTKNSVELIKAYYGTKTYLTMAQANYGAKQSPLV
jgi:hypothetical protein